MAVWIGLRMLWHGLVGNSNTMRPQQVSAVLRLLPSESFFSVFILGINPTPCGKWQKAATLPISWICVVVF
jgi:hypothetical protein